MSMNKRLDDRLLELAFDSRSPELPAEIRNDTDAAARLEEYTRMKSALNAMREIPEHQLSTERLRAALLQQDIKRRFAFPWQSVGYATTACTLFVCAFVAGRTYRQPHPDTKVVMGPAPVAKVLDANVPKLNVNPVRRTSSQASYAALAPHHGELPHVHSNTAFVQLASNDSDRSAKAIISEASGLFGHDAPAPQRDGTSESATPNGIAYQGGLQSASKLVNVDVRTKDGRTPTLVGGKLNPRDKVVVLQADTDSTSGLDTAQEVTSNQNVLYGG